MFSHATTCSADHRRRRSEADISFLIRPTFYDPSREKFRVADAGCYKATLAAGTSIRYTGYCSAIAPKSAKGAAMDRGKCLRPLDATRTYSRRIGARCSGAPARDAREQMLLEK